MRISVIAAAFALCLPTVAMAAEEAPPPLAAPVKVAKAAKPKRICRIVPGGEATGSHMSPPRECHTAQEWAVLSGTESHAAISSSRSGRSTSSDSD